jgi:hypothetical protein
MNAHKTVHVCITAADSTIGENDLATLAFIISDATYVRTVLLSYNPQGFSVAKALLY